MWNGLIYADALTLSTCLRDTFPFALPFVIVPFGEPFLTGTIGGGKVGSLCGTGGVDWTPGGGKAAVIGAMGVGWAIAWK